MLPPVEHVAVTPFVSPGRHCAHIAARVGFCDADSRFVACQDKIGSTLALRVGAVGHHGRDGAHVGLDDDTCRDRTRARHLLNDQQRVEKAPSLAAIFLRDGHSHEALGFQRFHNIPWIFARLIDLGGAFA
jgi:hypothetical protein